MIIKPISEHYNGFDHSVPIDFNGNLSTDIEKYSKLFPKKKSTETCFTIYSNHVNKTHSISNSYFVGVDWIDDYNVLYVEPKLNKDSTQTNYLQLLFLALKNPELAPYTEDLFHIKWSEPSILISQKQDLITPLLVVQFLNLVESIVRKGLKKSYYKVERNLTSKVKGKIQVSKTIKHNLLKNKLLNTYCSFDEFGFNNLENKVLKKALNFIQKYLPTLKNLKVDDYLSNKYNYINPAFQFIDDNVEINELKNLKSNVFYREYDEALRLAKIILKKFGYNITNVNNNESVSVPPFWIDMSLLFELYVYDKLKSKYKNEIHFQYHGHGTYLDFLITKNGEEQIIDAKYKTIYHSGYDIDNIRQLSGYARDSKVLDTLKYSKKDQLSKVLKCLIIFPDNSKSELLDENHEVDISDFVNFYKLPIALPLI